MTAAVLYCTMMMMAEPVSPEAARQAAAKFMNKKGISLKSEAMRAKNRVMHISADVGKQKEFSPYYVFNASQGFVVVSGDDCVGDNLVLGYTERGSFDAETIPDNLQWWLDEMADQVSTLSRLGLEARKVALHNDITPMLTACWDQYFPYNAFCPVINGQLCVTGCMATALSQVMYYHRWPQGPIANVLPPYRMADGRWIDGLPVTAFDWDNMVDDYRKPTTEAQQAAVATLMRYCGQTIQMDYTPKVSNGTIYDIDLLVNTFGYAPDLYDAEANGYTVSGWDELLYNELREGRPLVCCGLSTGGGHAFVIDGYEVQDGEGYFSVNWGWSGNGNGFYKINLLNPDMSGSGGSTTKDGYCRNLRALIGLHPQQGASEGYYRYLDGFRWDVTYNDSEHMFLIINPSYRPGTFTIGIAERNDDGTPDLSRICTSKEYEITGFSNADVLQNNMSSLSLTNDLFSDLTPGRHNLVFVNREAGTSAPWKPLFGPNCYIEVNIGEAGEVEDVTIHPYSQLAVSGSSIRVDGLRQRGIAQKVTATIQNTGTEDYVGGIECAVYYVEDGELKDMTGLFNIGIMVEAGDSSDIYFNISGPVAGEYVLLLTKQNTGVDVSGSKLADITQAPGYLAHQSVAFDKLNFFCERAKYSERNDEKGNPAYYLDLVVANGTPMDYAAVVLVEFYKPNDEGGYDPVVFPSEPYVYTWIKLSSNERKSFSIRLPEALEAGEYGINLLIANDFHSSLLSDYFVFASGPLSVVNTTGIEKTTIPEAEYGKWYDLNGRQLSGKPAVRSTDGRLFPQGLKKGIYIYKGRKHIVK